MIFKNILYALGLVATVVASPVRAEDSKMATAILAGGCFWCVQTDMEELSGVSKVVSGYSGGTIPNPTYENYHDQIDGYEPHVEVVEVTYDPAKISYDKLLDYYFRHIDPTDGGGQFCDRGPAYRPVIYYANDAEKAAAEAKKAEVARVLGAAVEVDVLPARTFWPAEDYHQDYHSKNPVRYKYYRWGCGRDQRVQQLWGGK
ncbi:MAG: peptide-methionine (S)-S-oxide reductase MsrA [Proteobacteria bacterium]|nr:peptide-methionine (S)-S-oxide reductase MsrA [Pseudomonadota bacterium]